ncbi:MAG: two-component system response regulator [Deltaproteobacteria bacterium]|nr:MAG: two-component system response regulator [Deltaproteobacteria bacterium]
MHNAEELYNSNILIVDDNVSNIVLLESLLEDAGYKNCVSTTDPRKVESLCANHDFDLILLDVRMPYLSGIEVIYLLKEQVERDFIPILVMTAQTDLKTKRDALEAGAKDFLTKPFENWEVLLRIKNMLETKYFYRRQVIRADVLENEVKRRTLDLREAQLEIVLSLGRVSKYRDSDTGNHLLRMSKITELMARSLGFSDHKCELFLYASPMHDVGKVAIPDAVLLKKGALDEDEWKIMRSHTWLGAEILGSYDSDIMRLASEMALYHHEKWDGTGYPHGLSGENIPVSARIVALSDVFDALTSKRPYKEAWPVEDAVEFLKAQSGRHFDPALLKIFLDNLPDVIGLITRNPDAKTRK